MLRVRLQLPLGQQQSYSHYDLVHDAIINAFVAAGASSQLLLGFKACPWSFAALGCRKNNQSYTHSLIITTTHSELASYLSRINPADMQKIRGFSQESFNFSAATLLIEPDPIPPTQGIMSVLLLSPLLIQDRERTTQKKKHWHSNFSEVALTEAINYRLSHLAQREIKLMVQADPLYLRANPDHATLVKIKQFPNGKGSFVIGMQAPLVIAGSEEDLRFAWYSGIGEKNRNGFGCLGLLEHGVGR